MTALPQAFTDQMQTLLGDEFPAFLESYNRPRKYALRVNTLKITPEQFAQMAPFHLTQVPWIPNAFYYEEEDAVSRHPFYYAGLYYLQEPTAMTPAFVLNARPGDRVLDLCAAPGGKATALGAALKGQGLLVANDISASRVKALLKNIEVFGIVNSLITNTTAAKLEEHFPEYFDKVLVDAPCSGEAMFRKDEALIRAWYPDKPKECAKIQKELVLRASDMLRPGGQMLYSTCSFAPEENEDIVAYLLSERPRMHLKKIPYAEGFAPGLGRADLVDCVRLWPHRIGGEGHFLALLEKEGSAPAPLPDPAGHEKKNKKKASGRSSSLKQEGPSRQLIRQFFEQTGLSFGAVNGSSAPDEADSAKTARPDPAWIEIRKDQVFCPAVSASEAAGIPFVRNGVYLGELKKDRFEPGQALAMAAAAGRSCLSLPCSDERIARYLRGETITLMPEDRLVQEKNGWVLVCAEGYPLGWARKTGSLLKNKYHPGWRIKA